MGASGANGGSSRSGDGSSGQDGGSGGSSQLVGQGNNWKKLMNLIMQLRKVVNHPFMMPDSEPRGEGSSTLQELLNASGRLYS